MHTSERLLVGILGNARSGKTHTWNTLFGHEVRTGKNVRRLYFNDLEYVEIFLVSRSPGKRGIPPAKILHGLQPAIVLCSLQYQASLLSTLDFFKKNNYAMYLQWLNPGYSDEEENPLFIDLGMITRILAQTSYIAVRSGKAAPEGRVDEILDFVYGWASRRGLVKTRRPLQPKKTEGLTPA